MHTLLFLLKLGLGLGLILVAGCSTAQKSSAQAPDAPLLHFQKTPCLGTCPSYEATILANGSIRYTGYSHVPVKDTVTFTLSPQQLEAIRQEITKLNYASLQDMYLTNWSDMPSTITTFYEAGKEVKRVQQEEGGPKPLLDFQERVHTLLMNLAEEEAKRRLPVR
ncbi:DUF6438 domain-containing protein [Pontibacter lucknowensis]|uniref:DUF6438 domain-containing protein n=1 Tax=Pontibacter lucknowensis TaxID=1077936 RepID=A0A1N7AQU5_9BACT|nr:DUF6438 domain-containing protein [Pontibacter lucknowensis]SIR41432.1 hypothetical protein SAMN05421545_3505 [Pontibacter lucknowensis]